MAGLIGSRTDVVERRMSKAKTPAEEIRHPSADTLVALNALLAQRETPERGRKAWELIVAAVGHADFHAVLDFALDKGLAAPCEATRNEPNPTWVNPKDGSEMVWVPPGRFVVGKDDQPADCGGFSLAKYPVTNAQFKQFLDETGYAPAADEGADAEADGEYENGEFLQHWSGGKIPRGKERHPVVFVSYLDALAYCRWAGLTLPGEFLWEKAARGPEGRVFPWGDARPGAGRLAQTGLTDTCPVDKFDRVRSPYGCSGLIGNVSEWCQPGHEKKPGDFPPHAPQAKASQRGKPVYAAVRGSAYMRHEAKLMKSAHRRRLAAARRNHWVGFRPALLLPCRPAG